MAVFISKFQSTNLIPATSVSAVMNGQLEYEIIRSQRRPAHRFHTFTQDYWVIFNRSLKTKTKRNTHIKGPATFDTCATTPLLGIDAVQSSRNKPGWVYENHKGDAIHASLILHWLPIELLLLIAKNLDSEKDISSFARVSRNFYRSI
jgi:hypothetical protein